MGYPVIKNMEYPPPNSRPWIKSVDPPIVDPSCKSEGPTNSRPVGIEDPSWAGAAGAQAGASVEAQQLKVNE